MPFPFGHALGRPDDPVLQHRVLRAALDLLAEPAASPACPPRVSAAWCASSRPSRPARPRFIRYCADDWKALYFEGRLAMKPGVTGDEVTRWFWGETAAGQVLRGVRDRLDASEDPRWKAAAFGVAR
ncbi:MAG TPA: hypothetical protein VFO08_14620 [Methylomirabilota bacterium]|nr:hypothetical protein [Methylomirabilota bacterium]